MTTYEYEGDRLVRSVTVREPEYGAGDLALLLQWWRERSEPRGSHGFPLAEAMSPDADPSSWDAKYRFVVLPPSRDFAQAELDREKAAYRAKYPDADMESLLWRVKRVEL